MSTDERLAQVLADVIDAGAPSRAPDRLVPETLRAVRGVTRWPRWLALIKEPPMRVSSRVAVGSPTARITAILAATFLLALLATGVVVGATSLLAGPGLLIVAQDGSGTHDSIADAVAAADDGDTILVRPGTYIEAVVVDKDITISGDGPRDDIVIEAPPDGPRVLIEEDGSEEDPYAILLDASVGTLSGLTFRGEPSEVVASGGSPTLESLSFDHAGFPFDGSSTSARGSSIIVNRGSTAIVKDNVLTGGGPIGIFDGSTPLVEGNTLSDGPHIWGGPGDGTVIRANTITDAVVRGIGLFDGTGAVRVEGNVIANAGEAGISAWSGSVHITRNTITGAGRYGIETEAGADVRIEANELADNAVGVIVAVGSARDNSLSGNRVGISLSGVAEATANEVVDGVTGVVATAGTPTIADNTIRGNEQGLVLATGATPRLSGNTICDNVTNLVVPDGAVAPDTTGNEICADRAG